jgi:cold shock CspA family protein
VAEGGTAAPSGGPAGLARLAAERVGTVGAFDDDRGLGEVTEDGPDGAGRTWPFHCTAVADGSRHADAGARVRFRLRAGHLGALEADGLAPADPAP